MYKCIKFSDWEKTLNNGSKNQTMLNSSPALLNGVLRHSLAKITFSYLSGFFGTA
jgi:hypothetical protein